LTEIVRCTEEQDIVEFLVRFTLCCQVEPGQICSDQDLVLSQLSVFIGFARLLPRRSSITQLFLFATHKLQPPLVPLLLWLCVAAKPEAARKFVSALTLEWRGGHKVLKQLLLFLKRRWRECPRQRDGVNFCPYFGALRWAADHSFGLKTVNRMMKQEMGPGFRAWYLHERHQKRNSLTPVGDLKEQHQQQKRPSNHNRNGSRILRFRRYRPTS
jgi:hypothetical protein